MISTRTLAARKAITTLRLNKLSNNNPEIISLLCKEIQQLEYAFDDDMSKDSIIAKSITQTTWKSFCRFGSRKSASPGLILYWIDNKGMPLDEQAMWMSEGYREEVSPDELAAFMMQYDRGLSYYEPIQAIIQAKKIFKELTGFNYNPDFVKEHILRPVFAETDSDNPF